MLELDPEGMCFFFCFCVCVIVFCSVGAHVHRVESTMEHEHLLLCGRVFEFLVWCCSPCVSEFGGDFSGNFEECDSALHRHWRGLGF